MESQMQVYVRLFPLPNRDYQSLNISKDCKDVYIYNKISNNSLSGKKVDKYMRFPTSGVFINNSQEEIYHSISQDIFTKLFKGENIIIMATGQHGCGKSFTMTGYCGMYENRGLSLRLVDDLFREISCRKFELRTELLASYTDFAAENMIDLLTEPAVQINHMNQIKKLKVRSKEELMKIMLLGEKKRWIKDMSSHCATSVLTFYLKCTSKIKSQPYDYFPHMQLIELNSGEPVSNPKSSQIKSNKDLAEMSLYLTLKRNLVASRSSSKLVSFLTKTWNNSFIRVICHLKPIPENSHLNMSSLIFINRLMSRRMYCYDLQRTNNPLINFQYALQMIQRLEEEMIVREMIIGAGFRYAENVDQKEMDFALSACNKFLNNEISIESLLSTAHPHILIKAMKKMFEQFTDKDNKSATSYHHSTSSSNKFDKVSVQKFNVMKKKGGVHGKDKKVSGVPAGSSESNSYEGATEELKSSQDIPDRKTIEAEFFTRYPEYRTQLELAKENYKTALEIRDKVYDDYEKFKKEANEEKTLEENIMWKRRLDVGECVGPDGRLLWAVPEKKEAQEACQIARREASEALDVATNARNTLSELRILIEEKIQVYMDKAYGEWTPAFELEEMKTCYEKVDVLLDSQDKHIAIDIKERDFFYRMQCSRNSNPFKKEIRWQ